MAGEKEAGVLKPGEIIKPFVTPDIAKKLIRDLYGLTAVNIKEFNSYDDRNFYFSAEPEFDNPHIKALCEDGYILKITNKKDSEDVEFFDAQNQMILHMAEFGLEVPVPIHNKQGMYKSVEEIEAPAPNDWTANNVGSRPKGKHMVRILKFIPGKILYDIHPWTVKHFYQSGVFVAKMDQALRSFDHPAYHTRNSIWFLSSIPNLSEFTFAVKNDADRALVQDVIDTFNKEVIPIQDSLEKSIIHGDYNEQNVLVRKEEDEYKVFSVIDFGDSQRNPLIYELGVAIMYMMTKCTEIHPNLAGGHVLAGYVTERPLPTEEKAILRECVAARYAQSLVMGAYSYAQDPGNEYLLVTAKTGWKTLREFWETPKEQLYNSWDDIVRSYQ